jgi:hypothetical protein
MRLNTEAAEVGPEEAEPEGDTAGAVAEEQGAVGVLADLEGVAKAVRGGRAEVAEKADREIRVRAETVVPPHYRVYLQSRSRARFFRPCPIHPRTINRF